MANIVDTEKDIPELSKTPKLVVHDIMDWEQYFAGIVLDTLRQRQEQEMERIGGDFEKVASRLERILRFLAPASYLSIFSPRQPISSLQDLYDPLISSPEGQVVREALKGNKYIRDDKALDRYVAMEFIHSSDPRLREMYDNLVGKRLFESIPLNLIFIEEGYPKVGLLKTEQLFHSSNPCLIEGCDAAWNGGYTIISETGRMSYINDGVLHFIRAHHLFEVSSARKPYDINTGSNSAAISPEDFYKHFMGDKRQ